MSNTIDFAVNAWHVKVYTDPSQPSLTNFLTRAEYRMPVKLITENACRVFERIIRCWCLENKDDTLITWKNANEF